MKTGIELIAEERQEQIKKHKWSLFHDTKHNNNELIYAAAYALEPNKFNGSRFDWISFQLKIDSKAEIERLKVAGALIAAEIDRLQNIEK